MILAGGTGGHVFPGLAVAKQLRQRGVDVVWLGTRKGLEASTVPGAGFAMEWISIQGLRGKGIFGWLLLPWRLLRAMIQAFRILRKQKPTVVASFGGFVAGPGALVARMLRKPLVVHEANAVPGFTNRILSYFADIVLCGFPETFGKRAGIIYVGNPVREEITALQQTLGNDRGTQDGLRLLIIGGSQGARIFNQIVPLALESLSPAVRPEVWHQCGRNHKASTDALYNKVQVAAKVSEFIEDMAEAYRWADIVLCRAGAMTVSELAVVGRTSILVPFPYATDDHQTANARFLADRDGAILLPQKEFTTERLQKILQSFIDNPGLIKQMSEHAKACGISDAAERVSQYCLEASHA